MARRYLRSAASAALSIFVLTPIDDARACGAAYPGGPMVCTMADAPGKRAPTPAPRAPTRIFASYAYTSTTLLFGEGRRADMTRHAAFAGTELAVSRSAALRFGAGGIVAGDLIVAGARSTLGPGATAFFGVGVTVVDEKPDVPFVQLSGTLSATRAATRAGPREAPSFTALDLRAAATAGKTIARVLVPYVALRAFGGPIYWRVAGEDVTGTDLYKYQVAGGLALTLPSRVLDAFVEGVPLGESGMSAGLGTTF